jgi:MFS transporter, DHA1 family, multidrug resistance protein
MTISEARAPGVSNPTSLRTTRFRGRQPARPSIRRVLVLGVLVALGPFTIDMYLPALPAIAPDLASTSAAVQLTLTGTLLGIAMGQLVTGPLSDALGRRRPLMVGIAVHVLASLLCVLAPDVAVLGVLRGLQGFGAASASVIAMAVVRDLYSGRAAATLFSRLMLVIGAAPVLAPTLGGGVLQWSDWRTIFVVLAVLGAGVLAVAIAAVSETLPVHRRRDVGLADAARTYAELLRDRAFLGLVLVGGLVMAALFGYVSGSTFVFQGQYALSQQAFALLFGAGAIGLIGASQLTVVLLRRWEPREVLVAGLVLATLATLALVACTILGISGLPVMLVLLWIMLAGQGLTLPTIPALAMADHANAAGSAAALLGAAQCGVAALSAPAVGLLGNDALAMSITVAAGMLAATTVLALVVGRRRLAAIDAVVEA